VPPRDWKLRIADILECITKIQAYTRGMNFDSFVADDKTIDAVVRNITIIGEAANHVPAQIAEAYPQIPWKVMRDLRNVVVHAYFGVKKQILWDTIQTNLPPLIPLLENLMAESKR
jgi:uncharacterized protein with HEPN domain